MQIDNIQSIALDDIAFIIAAFKESFEREEIKSRASDDINDAVLIELIPQILGQSRTHLKSKGKI